MYYGNRIICPACGMASDDEDYCTECGEVFSQYDDWQLKREGRRWFGIVDAVDVDRYECQYCGITISERVYNPDEMTIEYEQMICPACGARMMPIYKKTEEL